MEILYRCCCGLDVHQKKVVACLIRERHKEVRTFGTMTAELLALADWLQENGCTHVAMESTGVYWKPIYNLLEGTFEVILVNAQHLKAVPGRKTDVKDAEWIAQLLQHGLVRGSFIPPRPIRELRDLTRHRTRLIQQRAAVANRVAKVLEDANIKLKAVVSDMQGKTALAIVEALTRGEKEPAVLAELARGQLKSKKQELKQALEGRVTEHHQFLLRELVGQLRYLEGAIQRVSQEIQRRMGPFEGAAQIWDGIPGIDRVAAENLVAEIGVDMSQFPTAGHLSSWAGMCPGQNESAGKQHSGKTRKGSPWLGRTLTQAAWAASRKKNSYFKAQYHRLAGRRGKKRAIVAVGHSLLVVAYHLLKNGVMYEELGEDFFDRLNEERLTRHAVKRLERLGYKVNLERTAA